MFSSSDAFADEVTGNDDVCMLTYNDLKNIQHAVKASDKKIYDAFALQTWLSKQYEMFFVIPGLSITEIEYCSVVNYRLKKYLNIAKFIFRSMHQSLKNNFSRIQKLRRYNKSHNKGHGINIIKVTHTIQTLKLQKLKMRKKGCLIPSSMSAFTPC
jgi:hypothetical protein